MRFLFVVLLSSMISASDTGDGHHNHWGAERYSANEPHAPMTPKPRGEFPNVTANRSLVAYHINVPSRSLSQTSSIHAEKIETKCCSDNCCNVS